MKAKRTLNKVADLLNKKLVSELRDQGHHLTGALERSITGAFRVIEKSKETELNGYALEYAQDLETGQPSNGKLPTVAELTKYFILRGLSSNEATQAAILTARKQAKEGMPTKASSRFSKTGERKHFIERTWRSNEQKVDSLVDVGMDAIFNEEFNLQKSETI
jgi:hypothetical protein